MNTERTVKKQINTGILERQLLLKLSFMEFLHRQSRYNESSLSQYFSMKQKVGLLIFYDKQSKEAPIVFKTRNLTKSIAKTNITSTNNIHVPKAESSIIVEVCPNNPLIKSCLLSSHGLRRRVGGTTTSLKPDRFDHTLDLLPLTVCTKHGNASFLPLDCVRKMPEYSRTTRNYPVFKVIHSFEDCILEFPYPPPLGSSEENGFHHGYMNECYQCSTKLSYRRSVYMYRDYLFCCPGCRLSACATHYWYKRAMKAVEEEENGNGSVMISTMEEGTVFTIESGF